MCHEVGAGFGHLVDLEVAKHEDDGATGRIMTHGSSPDVGNRSSRR